MSPLERIAAAMRGPDSIVVSLAARGATIIADVEPGEPRVTGAVFGDLGADEVLRLLRDEVADALEAGGCLDAAALLRDERGSFSSPGCTPRLSACFSARTQSRALRASEFCSSDGARALAAGSGCIRLHDVCRKHLCAHAVTERRERAAKLVRSRRHRYSTKVNGGHIRPTRKPPPTCARTLRARAGRVEDTYGIGERTHTAVTFVNKGAT